MAKMTKAARSAAAKKGWRTRRRNMPGGSRGRKKAASRAKRGGLHDGRKKRQYEAFYSMPFQREGEDVYLTERGRRYKFATYTDSLPSVRRLRQSLIKLGYKVEGRVVEDYDGTRYYRIFTNPPYVPGRRVGLVTKARLKLNKMRRGY